MGHRGVFIPIFIFLKKVCFPQLDTLLDCPLKHNEIKVIRIAGTGRLKVGLRTEVTVLSPRFSGPMCITIDRTRLLIGRMYFFTDRSVPPDLLIRNTCAPSMDVSTTTIPVAVWDIDKPAICKIVGH
jgi:hypothetical protein